MLVQELRVKILPWLTRNELEDVRDAYDLNTPPVPNETDNALRARINNHLDGLPRRDIALWVPPVTWQQKLVAIFIAIEIVADIIWLPSLFIPYDGQRAVVTIMLVVTLLGSLATIIYGFWLQSTPLRSRRGILGIILAATIAFGLEAIALVLLIRAPLEDALVIGSLALLWVLSAIADTVAAVKTLK